jgi:hypothetical protein
MLRLLFWILVIGIVVCVLEGAVPIPGVPEDEIVYATSPPVAGCGSTGCIVVYELLVANVGRSTQDTVRVRLRSDGMANPVIAPTIRRADEAVVATMGTDRAGIDMLQLGGLAPEERVALVFALRSGTRESAPGWDRLLVGVDPAAGSARPGDVGALTAGRIVNAAGRVVHRVVLAVRKAIASE